MRLPSNIYIKLSLAVLVVVLGFGGFAAAEQDMQSPTKTISAMGAGKIFKNDSASAREAAIADGLDRAIDRVLSEFLPLETILADFQTLNHLFDGQTGKFIQGFRVLAESSSATKYKVLIEATVSMTLLTEHLSQAGILIGKTPMPRTLFLVSEKNLYDPHPRYWWEKGASPAPSLSENALAAIFDSKGFPVISHDILATDILTGSGLGRPDLGDQEAVNLGLQFHADVVVVGTTTAGRGPNVLGETVRSFQGDITLRALRTDKGIEIAATRQRSVTANSDENAGAREALATAGELAGKDLSKKIAAVWQKKDEKLGMIEIMLEGTENLAGFVRFRTVLKEMPGVKSLQIKELKSNQAMIVVDFQGSARELADRLILKSFETVGINIFEVSENYLKIGLIPG